MQFYRFLLVVFVAFFSQLTLAHGPTPQKVDESIEINAPVDKVWQVVKDFSKLDTWHPLVEKVTMVDEFTREVYIKGKGKGKIVDSLDEVDEEAKLLSYRLYEEDPEVIPVSFYTITLTVEKHDKGSKLNWQGRFYRADTGNFPPEHLNDATAVKAMTEYAQQGMQQLKAMIEESK